MQEHSRTQVTCSAAITIFVIEVKDEVMLVSLHQMCGLTDAGDSISLSHYPILSTGPKEVGDFFKWCRDPLNRLAIYVKFVIEW